MKYKCITTLVDFSEENSPNNSKAIYSIGNSNIEIEYNHNTKRPNDFLFVDVEYNSDDENGGSIHFEARSISIITEPHSKPNAVDLVESVKFSMQEINALFQTESNKKNIGFGSDIIYFVDGRFTEIDLLIDLGQKIEQAYQL